MRHTTSSDNFIPVVGNHTSGSATPAPSDAGASALVLRDNAQSLGDRLKQTVQGGLDYVQQAASAVAQVVVSESNGRKTTVGDLAAQAVAGGQAAASHLAATGAQMGSDAWAVLQDKAPELTNALLTGISSLASALDWHQEDGARVLKFGINPVADMLPRDGDGFALRDAAAGGSQGEPDVSTQENAPHCMLVAPNDDLAVWMNGALG